MSTNIPSVTGLPGVSSPPNWFSAPPTGNFALDDFHWFGSTQRTFGGGVSASATFRAISGSEAGQAYLYLTLRANFVPVLSDNRDVVYLGLQSAGGTKAMVVRIQVHPPTFTPAGPPSANPPASVASVKISTLAAGATAWTPQTMPPTWVTANARAWIQTDTDVASDPNNRWAVQVRIPLTNAVDIADNAGPNLGNMFPMWYFIHGALADGSPLLLADNRATGTTLFFDLLNGRYPLPADWDQFTTGAGAATTGGVTIFGNDYDDIVVRNVYGIGTTLANGGANTFIARPRNYRATGDDILAGKVDATFRIANFGSVGGDPNNFNISSATWDYVPGNNAVTPVFSGLDVPVLASGANPPATEPIALAVPVLTLGAGHSLHQCLFVTLSGTSLNILTDSAYKNMDFDHASTVEREASIDLRNMKPLSAGPRAVRLAVEKVNLPATTPAGTNEGQYLAQTTARLIKEGGALAQKLKKANAKLAKDGDAGSANQLDVLLKQLSALLGRAKYLDASRDRGTLKPLLVAFQAWIQQLKAAGTLVNDLAILLQRVATLLLAAKQDRAAKLASVMTALTAWLPSVPADSKTLELTLVLLRALRAWAMTLVAGERLDLALQALETALRSGRFAADLLRPLEKFLDASGTLAGPLQIGLTSWLLAAGKWAKGSERLAYFVSVLNECGLTGSEMSQLFPSVRVHVYTDTGERTRGPGGQQLAVWRVQPSFGLNVYHEGPLAGWQVSVEGAKAITKSVYELSVDNATPATVKLVIEALDKRDKRPKDPVVKPR